MSRFRFSFDSLIWKNMRRTIRESTPSPEMINPDGTGGLSNSLWYRILFAFLIVLQERLIRVNWLYQQIWLDSASGKGLDWWGARYGLLRSPGEKDSSYFLQILFVLEYKRLPATIATKRALISRVTRHSIERILVEQAYDYQYRMGDPIGSIVGSRDYCFHAFRIYIPSTNKTNRQNLIRILDATNIGGNVWEVWEELDSLDPLPASSEGQVWKGTKISEGPLGSERYWLVY